MRVPPLLPFVSCFAIALTPSLATTFNQLDADKNGYITSEEVFAYFEPDHKRMDQNKDGVVSMEEWQSQPATFRDLDSNKDGDLSHEELTQWRQREVIESKDKDKDGQVDSEEYETP